MASEPERESETGERPAVRGRQKFLTPEQRRFLATPRAPREKDAEPIEPAAPATPAREADPPAAPPPSRRASEPRESREKIAPARAHAADESTPTAPTNVRSVARAGRAVELRGALFVIGTIVFVAIAFYAGKKFDHFRYLIASKKRAAELDQVAEKFPGVSAEELIDTGLAAQKRGDWADAVDRLLAAKRKNLALPGVLFLVGKGSFDRGQLDIADQAFSHAIRFNENVAASNYHRGLIALRRQDTGAAVRYFEAAANAEPFISDTYYSWAEALRLDNRARDAIRRYEQAEQRASRPDDSTLCAFKIRLARIEAGDAAAVATAIEQRRNAGPLTVDWVMSDAALHLHQGKTADAARLIGEARALGAPGQFLVCAGDAVFRKAAETHAEVAASLRSVAAPAP